NVVRLWRRKEVGWAAEKELKHGFAISALAACPDRAGLAVVTTKGQVLLWDVSRPDRPQEAITPDVVVTGLAFARDGKALAATWANKLLVWPDWRTLDNYQAIPSQSPYAHMKGVAFAPDGQSLLIGSSERTLVVWDRGPGGWAERPLPGHSHTVNALA